MPQKRWSDEEFLSIERWRSEGIEWSEIGNRLDVTENAARKSYGHWRKSAGRHRQQQETRSVESNSDSRSPRIQPIPAVPNSMLDDGPQLPPAFPREYIPLQINDVGSWLILSDIHLPYHDTRAIEAAVRKGQERNVVGILLNGDTFDFHELSRFDKDPRNPRYIQEREAGFQLFAYLRYKFPRARIIFKEGNHEERLSIYLMQRAPALFGIEELQLPAIMKMGNYGIEFVGDKRVVRLGKNNVIHGHEFRPNIQAPVNPARGLFLRAKSQAMCGHLHQTSEHHEPTITGKPIGCWSTGCLCQLNPMYCPINKWNHGFAIEDIHSGGNFSIQNYRVIDGEVL